MTDGKQHVSIVICDDTDTTCNMYNTRVDDRYIEWAKHDYVQPHFDPFEDFVTNGDENLASNFLYHYLNNSYDTAIQIANRQTNSAIFVATRLAGEMRLVDLVTFFFALPAKGQTGERWLDDEWYHDELRKNKAFTHLLQ